MITVILIPLIRAKLTEAQNQKLTMWVNVAVAAAEQLFRESGAGEKKKLYVLGFLQSKGYTYDSDTIDVMIEAAVKNLNIVQK
ncbi:MAG: phage holin, LLH family [Oscillospiraceae bacterium]